MLLDLSRLPDLQPPRVGHTILHLRSLPSTNELLMGMARAGRASDGFVVVAEEQTAGKGRHERRWVAAAGSGLLTSILLSWPDPANAYAGLALAVRDALADAGAPELAIKWPNDVLSSERKIAGILIERIEALIVAGIGINSDMAQAELDRIGKQVTSLRVAIGRPVDQTWLLERLLARVEEQRERARHFPEKVFQDWQGSLVTIGREVEVETPQDIWAGQALDVARDGSLLVSKNKRIVRVYAADVRLRMR